MIMGDAALIKKLGIKPGQRAAVINPPDGYADRIGPPQGVEATSELDGTFDFVQLFAKDRATLDRHLKAAHGALEPGGLFWISYPKGSSKVPTDLNRDVFWEALGHLGSVLSPRSQWTRCGRRFGSAHSPRWVPARPATRRRRPPGSCWPSREGKVVGGRPVILTVIPTGCTRPYRNALAGQPS
jgi:hypothetical protein